VRKSLIILQHIYSRDDAPNFVIIVRVLQEILQKYFGLYFLDTVYNCDFMSYCNSLL